MNLTDGLMQWLQRGRRSVRPLAPQMREHSVRCFGGQGFHRLAWTEWGDPDNPQVLVCVHGLTRNGRDFDELARALSVAYRVVCPDMPGRGRSDWLADKRDYGMPRYQADVMTLLAALGAETVDWVGTSMGGLIGMHLAALTGNPIRRMVLNDVGPRISSQSLRRIGEYVGRANHFPDFAAAEAYIRLVSAPFGRLSDAQWRHLTQTTIRPHPEGGFELNYDPDIGASFRALPIMSDLEIWDIYDAIRCPTLVIRGVESDLLSPQTLREMSRRGPHAFITEVADAGHAPALMDPAQIELVRDFLLARGQYASDACPARPAQD